MAELVFLKLGGSLITDKTRPYTPRLDKLADLVKQIAAVLARSADLHLVLGHGSGSFGHFAVKEHMSHPTTAGREYWRGFAEVWYRASQLNRYVMEALHEAGVAAVSMPPSASVIAARGRVAHWDLSPLQAALEGGLVPVIYGDVVFDSEASGAILSTESLFEHLARVMRPQRILLAGLEAAVWADFPTRRQRVETVTRKTYNDSLSEKIGGSHGTDVTGGMKSKVEQMLSLVEAVPGLSAQIFSGEEPGNLEKALQGEQPGTLITS